MSHGRDADEGHGPAEGGTMSSGARTRSACAALTMSLAALLAPSCSADNDYCRAPHGLECLNIPDQCAKQPGCSLVTGCSGRNCKGSLDQAACEAFKTCYWTGDSCTNGNLSQCDGLDEEKCNGINGCVWGNACVGTLTSCRGLDQAQCKMVGHCSWEDSPSF